MLLALNELIHGGIVKLLLSFLLLCSVNFTFAGDIILGSSLPLSGPAEGLGTELKAGYDAYFAKINGAGGIKGSKIIVKAKDDQYEPRNTSTNSTELAEKEKVFALFGYVGTPTTQVALPVVDKNNIPLFGMFTGAGIFRNPINKNVFNVRASYNEEAERLASFFVDKNKLSKISLVVQADAFGGALKDATIAALKKRNLAIHSEGSYVRNTTDVQGAFEKVNSSSPDVIVFVGTYKAMAEFAKIMKEKGSKALLATISFIGTKGLIEATGANGEGIVISQVMPNPFDANVAIVKSYQETMIASGNSNFSYGSLEGFVYAYLFSKIAETLPAPLTREAFVKAASTFKADLEGLSVDFSRGGNQALGKVYLTKISGGKVVNID